MGQSPSVPYDYDYFLNLVASRLSSDGLSVQRRIQVGRFMFDSLATRTVIATGYMDIKIPWFDIVGVTRMETPTLVAVQDYTSFVLKFAVKNRLSLGVHRNGLITIAAIVSTSFGDDIIQWVSEAVPSFSKFWANLEFPVLVDLATHQIFYFDKMWKGHQWLSEHSRTMSDKWFSFSLA